MAGKVNKGMGDSSLPLRQNPQVPGMPGKSSVNKGLGDKSVPMKHNWQAPINQSAGGKKAAPLD